MWRECRYTYEDLNIHLHAVERIFVVMIVIVSTLRNQGLGLCSGHMYMNYITSFTDMKAVDTCFYETNELHIKTNMFHTEAEVKDFVSKQDRLA